VYHRLKPMKFRHYPAHYILFLAAAFTALPFLPPLLPRMLTKPRTVCGCQPVAFIISASVAPLARFISAITSAFLLARSVFGLAAFFARRGLLSRLRLLGCFAPGLRRFGFRCGVALDCVADH